MRKLPFIVLCLALISPSAAAQADRPRDFTARLIGHAHIDLSWLWRWEETVKDVAVQTFAGTLAQMSRMPGLTFAQSQAALYEAIEKSDPDLFRAIREAVREGTWIPVGGMWVEPDLNMIDGESLARQILYGKRYFLDTFGFDVKVGWNPDSFGHSWQLPQILARAGIQYYVFGRCAPENTVAFTWKGKDGSELLCYVPQGWYNVSLKNGVAGVVRDAAKISPLKDFMILYGAGDHGGGPRDEDLQAIRTFRKDRNHPRFEFVTPEAYFQMLERQKNALPVFAKELNFTFPACYTTQAETKKNNRTGENLLVTAEKFSALAAASGFRDYYPERDLDEAWKIVLRNQFHDILDGSSIGPVYDEARGFYREAFERGRRALDFSLEAIANGIDTRGEGLPLVVFNPLFWERTEPVLCDLPVSSGNRAFRILDASGSEVPFQVVVPAGAAGRAQRRIVFIAEGVPSFGYKTFRIVPAETMPEFASSVSSGPASLENEFFRIGLDPKTGWIVSLKDKAAVRELLRSPGFLQAIVDEPENMSAWELGLKNEAGKIGESGSEISVVESGPVRAVLRVRSPFRSSAFTQDIVLYGKVPRVDFRLEVDWQERNLMIKSAFPLDMKSGQAEFEIPYGSISRPADGAEVPALRWVDVTDDSGEFGISLLNDGKYGFDIRENTLRLSVVHGATYPDPEADRGRHELSYALVPHKGGWKDASSWRRGYEFNNPLIARIAMAHPGTLPASRSFITVGPGNVVLTALKKEMGYAQTGLILRFCELAGRTAEAAVELPWNVDAWETDLIERPRSRLAADGKTLKFPLAPYEIKTLRVVPKR